MTDPISDMLTRIRNAGRALLPTVEMPHSRMKESLANILKEEGYVAEVTVEAGMPKKLKLKLKYNGKKSVIEGLRRISKPGLRHYVGAAEIPRGDDAGIPGLAGDGTGQPRGAESVGIQRHSLCPQSAFTCLSGRLRPVGHDGH